VYTSGVRRGALRFLFNEIYLLIKKKKGFPSSQLCIMPRFCFGI